MSDKKEKRDVRVTDPFLFLLHAKMPYNSAPDIQDRALEHRFVMML